MKLCRQGFESFLFIRIFLNSLHPFSSSRFKHTLQPLGMPQETETSGELRSGIEAFIRSRHFEIHDGWSYVLGKDCLRNLDDVLIFL